MDSAFKCSATQDLWKTNAATGKCRIPAGSTARTSWNHEDRVPDQRQNLQWRREKSSFSMLAVS